MAFVPCARVRDVCVSVCRVHACVRACVRVIVCDCVCSLLALPTLSICGRTCELGV